MNPDDDTGLEFAFRNDAFLAQMVERWPFKPMVVGSIPTVGDSYKQAKNYYTLSRSNLFFSCCCYIIAGGDKCV